LHRAATSPASEVREVADVARRFIVDYLRHRRGALSASGIDGASSALREALAADGAPGGLGRGRRVRITELRTELDGDARALACARLLDGRHESLWLALTLEGTAAGWEVSGVSDR
jgi:hypothetical protein